MSTKKKVSIYRRYLIVAITLLGLLFAVGPSGVYASLAADAPSFWYYAGEEQVTLPLALDEIAIHFTAEASAEARQALLAGITGVNPLSGPMQVPTPELTLVQLLPGLDEAQVLQILEAVRADPAVAYAYPVFAFPEARLTLTDQFAVQFAAGVSQAEIDAFNAGHNVSLIKATRLPNTYLLRAGPGEDTLALANLYHESGLAVYATPDFVRFLHPQFTPNDTNYAEQWGMENTGTNPPDGVGTADADMDASTAWDIHMGDSEIVIAIIDEGVELNHEDLNGKIVANYSAITDDPNANPNNTWDAHGTNCAGIASAETNNAMGVAGVCPNCSLMAVQIAYSSYDGGPWITSDAWIADAMTWAVDNGADVLSNSWGGGSVSALINAAITHALTNGRGGLGSPVLFASGNGNGSIIYPANNNDTIAVGATSPCDERKNPDSCDGEYWWGSNYGPALDIVSPGVEWWSTDMMGAAGYGSGNYFDHMNGTSSATPAASGLAGLILSYKPCLTHAQVREILQDSAEDLVGLPAEDVAGWDQYMGWGRINAHDALLLAGEYPCGENLCGPHVYLDLFHDADGDAGYTSELAAMVVNELHGVFHEKTQFIDAAALDGYNILAIYDPENPLDPAEIAAIVDFVHAGGHLVVMGEGGLAANNASMNELLAAVGVNISLNGDSLNDPTNYEIYPYWPLIHQFAVHPLANGVGMSVLYYGSSLTVSAPAVALASGDEDSYISAAAPLNPQDDVGTTLANIAPQDIVPGAPVAMAYSQAGHGDVFVVGDSNLWENLDSDGDTIINLNEYDNRRLAFNVFNHDICASPGCHRILFDETHGVDVFTLGTYYSELKVFLESKGHSVEALQDPAPFDYATLSQYDVLVLVLPKEYYTDPEKDAIAQFVNEGGRLVTISEWGGYAGGSIAILNDVHAYLGDGLAHNNDVVYDPTNFYVHDFWPLISDFALDPVNQGLGTIVELAGSSLSVSGPAYGTAFGSSSSYTVGSAAAEAGASPSMPTPYQPQTFTAGPVPAPDGTMYLDGALVPAEGQALPPASEPAAAPLAPVTINFDDAAQPCFFASTYALRDAYAALGVTFSGPAVNDGGAILDQCGNFGVSGYSAPNFLAFNANSSLADGGIPRPPETMSFAVAVDSVQINAGSSSGAGRTLYMDAYDAFGNLLASDSLVLASTLQPLSVTANGIRSVVFSTDAAVFVLDDLNFNTSQVIVQAMAHLGAGTVFAVGDGNLWSGDDPEGNGVPTLYEFDNARLAHNVFAYGEVCTGCPVALFKDNFTPWEAGSAQDSQAPGAGIQGFSPDPNEVVLQDWGFPYDIFTSADLGVADLSRYCKIVVASEQPLTFYQALSAQRGWLEGWIANGAMFEFHGASYDINNWSGLPMPGGFSMVWNPINAVSILDPVHPLLNLPNVVTDASLDNWNYSTHGYLVDLPAGAHAILNHDGVSLPAAAEFNLGSGCVVATLQTLEWAWSFGYSPMLENYILYNQCSQVSTGTANGYVNLQGRTDDSGTEVCAWDGGTLISCDLADPTGYFELVLNPGLYDLKAEIGRYLDSVKTGVTVTTGGVTTLNTVTLPGGDANNDDWINIQDLAFMGARYLKGCGDPDYDARADINNDCIINIQDLAMTGGNYNLVSPVPWP